LQVGLPLLGGGALLTYAALNYHTTLKFVGVLGVMLTVANKLLSYDSPKDAFDDITGWCLTHMVLHRLCTKRPSLI
jgi:hypothetical protein